MTAYADLTPLDYFGEKFAPDLRSIGWLGREADFDRGEVARDFFDRLVELMGVRFEPIIAVGPHVCDLCQFDGPGGSGNLFVPGDGHLLVCPELIVHYIAAHHYRPPTLFQDAVMRCPQPGGMAYRKLFLASGGRSLLATK